MACRSAGTPPPGALAISSRLRSARTVRISLAHMVKGNWAGSVEPLTRSISVFPLSGFFPLRPLWKLPARWRRPGLPRTCSGGRQQLLADMGRVIAGAGPGINIAFRRQLGIGASTVTTLTPRFLAKLRLEGSFSPGPDPSRQDVASDTFVQILIQAVLSHILK